MCMELGGSAAKNDVVFPVMLAVTPVYHIQKVTDLQAESKFSVLAVLVPIGERKHH